MNESVNGRPMRPDVEEQLTQLARLAEIHPWMLKTLGEPLTKLQIIGRINFAMAALIEAAMAGSDPAIINSMSRVSVWLIHLAGTIGIDLIAVINANVMAEQAMTAEIARQQQDTAGRA